MVVLDDIAVVVVESRELMDSLRCLDAGENMLFGSVEEDPAAAAGAATGVDSFCESVFNTVLIA